ncbi:MAG: (Na+)-NQR maturation NqrM, partial [Gemmatimonadetes bacterium]|nr:(Na+)-NQR maturation NqrM [Gemmatimonadota bacterium]
IFSNREIQGSCGGLNKMSDDFGRPMCECGKAPGTCGEEQESPAELAQTV